MTTTNTCCMTSKMGAMIRIKKVITQFQREVTFHFNKGVTGLYSRPNRLPKTHLSAHFLTKF